MFRILILLLFLSSTVLGKGISGVYNSSKLGKIKIHAFGKENPGYFVSINENHYFFKPTDKSYVHFHRKSEKSVERWEIIRNKKHLSLLMNGISYSLKKKGNNTPTLTNFKKLSGDQQFDLNTQNYCAGEFYDLSPKAFMPFAFNREFIVSTKQKSLHVTWNEGKHASQKTVPRYEFIYAFDKYGNTSEMNVNTYYDGLISNNKISWEYFYRDKVTGLLDSVVMHTKIFSSDSLIDNTSLLLLDEDNWVVDEFGQKMPRALKFNWFYDSNGKPLKWEGKQGKREDFSMEFVYQDALLTKMIFRNKKTNDSTVNEFTFGYDQKGYLKSVTRVSN